jgi:hypothetical protein
VKRCVCVLALRPARDAVLRWLRPQPGHLSAHLEGLARSPRPGARGDLRRLGSFDRYAGREVPLPQEGGRTTGSGSRAGEGETTGRAGPVERAAAEPKPTIPTGTEDEVAGNEVREVATEQQPIQEQANVDAGREDTGNQNGATDATQGAGAGTLQEASRHPSRNWRSYWVGSQTWGSRQGTCWRKPPVTKFERTNLEKFLKEHDIAGPRKPSPTAKDCTSFRTRNLTPSEIESLRQNGREVSARVSAFFKQKIKDNPQPNP